MSVSDFAARSLLFAPGDSERKMAKALASEADLVLLDLEDAVAESAKPAARELTAATLRARGRGGPLVYVRINPLDTPHALDDLVAIVAAKPDGLMLPKACRADLDLLHNYLTALEAQAGVEQGAVKVIVVATETPKALFGLGDYEGAPRLAALTWGAEDIATALGATHNRDANGVYEFPYQLARTLCLAGAAAAKVPAIETIHGDFRDPAGLKAVADAARRAGFRGMMAIHPDQVAAINTAFSPSEAELARAKRIVDLFDANPGAGTLGLDGEMLDMPHLKRARAVLAMVRL
jgi:citrate lyase subunit beta/citryl-CoA lyase